MPGYQKSVEKDKISVSRGMEVCAPGNVQARLPATIPRRTAVAKSLPASNAAANAPTKLSPALVVSTAVTFGQEFPDAHPDAMPALPWDRA